MTLTWKRKSEVLQPMDTKPFMFLIKSYGKIDLLLNAGSKILINLQYGSGNADSWLTSADTPWLASLPAVDRESHPTVRFLLC